MTIPFRSKRLLYRAFNSPDDDEFFARVQRDPISFGNSRPVLQRPVANEYLEELKKRMQNNSLLYVIICKTNGDQDQDHKAEEEEEEEEQAVAATAQISTLPSANPDSSPRLSNPNSNPNPSPGKNNIVIVTETKKRAKRSWIEIEKNSEPIGLMVLKASSSPNMTVHRTAEIGIEIIKPYRGQGYGTEAIRWITEWAFREANLHRLEIQALGWNDGALKLYQRLGFKLEGIQRERFWRDGQWWDNSQLAMLEKDWRELK
jgi:RimJ/RimL family protein N-acetyltransferase